MELFGFQITRPAKDKKELRNQSFVPPSNDDGAAVISAGGYYGTFVDLDATAKSESDLIVRYRQASLYPECDMAIDEIVNESIAALDDEPPVKLNIDTLQASDNIKAAIEEAFNRVLKLLHFKEKGAEIFRRWYVDGRIYYQKVIDTSRPKVGIQELRYVDPRKIRKIRNIEKEKLPSGVEIVKTIDEFYLYNEQGITAAVGAGLGIPSQPMTTGIKITPDAIAYIPSGIMDMEKNIVLSHMHKAIKPVNQLKMMEDALVIYRISRAPERRIFYIDVGNLPKVKAEQYLKGIMDRYRNKIVYDSSTGEIRDDRKFMSMLEDFWLPRREGGKGTEITTLPGGENLGQIQDIEYFKMKLYKSLNVPISRLEPQNGLNFGRTIEITREELKFAKFINNLRMKFNGLFNDLLKTELILTGIITEDDWDMISETLEYRYAQDQYFKESKDAEILTSRMALLNQVQAFVGVYYSMDWVRRTILRQSDEEIKEQAMLMSYEPPPMSMQAQGMPTDMPPEQQG
jgi:hypothetical protein